MASVHRHEGKNADIWLLDFARSASARFTFHPGENLAPVWSPDGSQIIFASARVGPTDLYRKASSGAAEEEVLLQSRENELPQHWSRDGRFLLYAAMGTKTGWNLWVLPLEGGRKPTPFPATPFQENQGRFSPDGRWIVYTSDESGKAEVYVRPFPTPSGGGGKWMVSTAGGHQPRWRRDGKELFYFSPEGKLMSIEVSAGPSFKAGIPKLLFEAPIIGGAGGAAAERWDVTADGQRFLIRTQTIEAGSTPITVVLLVTSAFVQRTETTDDGRERPNIPKGMRKVQRHFERWRGSHPGRVLIPESLWASDCL